VLIGSSQAAAADYIDAMDVFIGQNAYRRTRAVTDRCEGCGICCHERVPLTSVDLWTLKRQVGADLNWRHFFQRFTLVRVFAGAVDIMLARDGDDVCVFLDPGSGLCRVYPYRPLACRTYICAQASPGAWLFRNCVINEGENAAVFLWYAQTKEKGLVIHECEDFDGYSLNMPRKRAWHKHRYYKDILLKEVVSRGLWRRLEGTS
jgi:Fe-S-cluster containining protein